MSALILQQCLNGLVLACNYTLFALGLSVIWGVLKVLNLAHAEMFTFGALAAVFAGQWAGLPLPLVVLVGILAGGGIALSTAITFVGQWEGLRTTAYRDVVGVWTVCYGETKGVRAGESYSKAECDAMLARELVAYEAALDQCLTHPVPVGMKIALVSWTYNVGAGAACRSTLVRKANRGDLAGACNELPRWNRAGGRVIRGLTNRRLSERAMCHRALKEAA